MQIDTNNIQKMVADAVRDAVAPLYEQMREIENKYYPDMNKQVPQQPEEPQKRYWHLLTIKPKEHEKAK